MKHQLQFVLLYCIFCLALNNKAKAIAPIIHSVIPNNTTIARYEKFELIVDVTATYASPYDFDQVNLQATFTSPSGNVFVVDGFYYQDFTMTQPNVLTPNGAPDWRIRFSPNQKGVWSYTVKITDTQGTASFPSQQFTCITSLHKGFVKRSGNNLVYDNGDRFLAIGTNLAWTEWASGFTIYDEWITSLKSYGANYVKITMAPWIFGLEWGSGAMGNYAGRQNRAWALDWVFDKLEQKNIYCQLHFLVHDELRTGVNPGWDDNPYKNTNGGPCANPQDFFTNSTAKKYFKQKLRYSNARWGYSSYLHSWEIMSEVDNVSFYNSNYSQIFNWLLEITNYVKSKDVYSRAASSGYAWPQNDSAYWNNSSVGYSQLHIYDFISDLEMKLYNYSRHYIEKYQKPNIISEFALGHEPNNIFQNDPEGVAFHNVLWSSVFSGTMGTAMSWWWNNYLYPNGFFNYFQPISNFITQVGIKETSWYHELPLTGSSVHETLNVYPDFTSTSEKAPANTFYIGPSGSVSPAVIDMGQHLFGSLYASLRNPPAFHVNYLKPGKFKVRTSGVAFLSKVKIRLDGVTLINTTASPNTTYTIDVPYGTHIIEVDNSGTGLLKIDRYIFENYMPQLRAFTFRKNDHIAGWFQNINYNWKYLKENGIPSPVNGGKIYLSTLTPGLYKINWYNGEALLDSTQIKFIPNGSFFLDAPQVIWDGAFEVKYFAPFNIDFSASPRTGLAPLNVQFSDQTTYLSGGDFSWLWDFGDGTYSSQQNPQKTYNTPGSYSVKLQVSQGQYSHSVTKINFIIVDQPLAADFSGSPTILAAGSPVQFTDLSLGNPNLWVWTYGDGSYGFQQNPIKVYQQPGIYTVSLMVQKGAQSSTKTKSDYIQVLPPLIADFTANKTWSIEGQAITFSDLSSGLPTIWIWDFGNGITSNEKNPTVTFSNPGVYDVTLIVANDYLQDTITKNDYITILPLLGADFKADTTLVVLGGYINFSDLSTGAPTSWNWNFGDGQSSVEQNPTHLYNAIGYYSIALTVKDSLQTSSSTKENYIQVLKPLIADFMTSQTVALPGQSISFTDLSTGSPTSWLWDFGNGTTSFLQNPNVSFANPGKYTVTLTVANNYLQNTVVKTDYITILEPLIADFEADTTFGWTGQNIYFTDLTTGNPDTWWWDFGDGQYSSDQNPVHIFEQEGYYTISLIANDLYQSSTITKTDYLYIRQPLIAEFVADTMLVVVGEIVSFTDLSTGFPEKWSWTFGDGQNSELQNPEHIYQNPGEYSVLLRIRRGSYSSSKVKLDYIKVIPELEADFTTDMQVALTFQLIQFTDLTTGGPTSWFWDFGNYSNSIDQNPLTSYSEPGIYSVSLIVSNEYLQDTVTKPDFINIIDPLVANFMADKYTVEIGETVQFTDLSTGGPQSWEWIFSDSTNSSVQNPSKTFLLSGYFDVTLIVANQYLTDTIIKNSIIHVLPATFTQILTLESGWSGISTFIQPATPIFEDLFSPVLEKIVYAFNEQGIYWPALNINTIGIWDVTKGLIINMNSFAELSVSGYNLVEEVMDLSNGWNIFPVFSQCEQPAEDMLLSLEGNFQLIKTADGTEFYWPETGINTLQTIKPGYSYLIYLKENASFSFPACSNQ